jgi:hypothetical protein
MLQFGSSLVRSHNAVTRSMRTFNKESATDRLPLKNNVFLLLTHYCAGDKIEKNEVGGACSAYGGGERRVQGFGGET